MTDPRFSIVTVCKGRLDHLRESLPAMLAQPDSEVIVVDYTCPDRTGDFVAKEFPNAKLVRVEGKEGFSNWAGRNAGVKAASGKILLFCDADIVLKPDTIERIAKIVGPRGFGMVKNSESRATVENADRLSFNQLKGFQVIPRAAFELVGGYDEVFTGYAAGGDTDIEVKLSFAGLRQVPLNPDLVDRVIHHDSAARTRFHGDAIGQSYLTGLLYRQAKHSLLRAHCRPELPEKMRQRIWALAHRQAAAFAEAGRTSMVVNIADSAIGMPRQIGFEDARMRVSVKIDVVGGTPLGVPKPTG